MHNFMRIELKPYTPYTDNSLYSALLWMGYLRKDGYKDELFCVSLLR